MAESSQTVEQVQSEQTPYHNPTKQTESTERHLYATNRCRTQTTKLNKWQKNEQTDDCK